MSYGPFEKNYTSKLVYKFINLIATTVIIAKASEVCAVPDQFVSDESGVLTKSSIDYIEKSLAKISQLKQEKIYLILVRNLPYAVEPQDYAKNLFYEQKMGPNDTVFLLVNKLSKIGVYHGDKVTELTDKMVDFISDEIYAPKAKNEQYTSAALDVTNKLTSVFLKNDLSTYKSSDSNQSNNFKSAKKTEESRSKYIAIIAVLLVIAFVVPMVQFFYYVKDE